MPAKTEQRGRSAGEAHVRAGEPLRALSEAVYHDEGFDRDTPVTWGALFRVVTRVGGVPLQTIADTIAEVVADPDGVVTWSELLRVLGLAEKPYQSGRSNR